MPRVAHPATPAKAKPAPLRVLSPRAINPLSRRGFSSSSERQDDEHWSSQLQTQRLHYACYKRILLCRWNKDVLLPMVNNNLYRMLHGPSQCGKTTRILAFCKWLDRDTSLLVRAPLVSSMSLLTTSPSVSMANVNDGAEFWHELGDGIRCSVKDYGVRLNIPLPQVKWWRL